MIKLLRNLLFSCTAILGLMSCQDEVLEFTILRESLVTFQVDTFYSYSSGEAQFLGGQTTVYTYPDSTQESFNSEILEVLGTDPLGHPYWLQIEIDTKLDGNYIGIYKKSYQKGIGGINDFRLTKLINGQYIEWGSANGNNEAYFQVEIQNFEEKLIRGIFGARLVNRTNPGDNDIIIDNGNFIDINY